MFGRNLKLLIWADLVELEFDRALVTHGGAVAFLMECELVDVGRV